MRCRRSGEHVTGRARVCYRDRRRIHRKHGGAVSTLNQPFWRTHLAAIAIGLLDVFLIGIGMGVPVFAILLGFGVGWWVARRPAPAAAVPDDPVRSRARALVSAAAALAAVSFCVLLAVWGPTLGNAFDPRFDAADWGLPLILYTSQASTLGWYALMLVISPLLQLMAVLTGGLASLALRPRRGGDRA